MCIGKPPFLKKTTTKKIKYLRDIVNVFRPVAQCLYHRGSISVALAKRSPSPRTARNNIWNIERNRRQVYQIRQDRPPMNSSSFRCTLQTGFDMKGKVTTVSSIPGPPYESHPRPRRRVGCRQGPYSRSRQAPYPTRDIPTGC